MSKKRIQLFLCLLLTFFLSIPTNAHSGKTDANGGHYDSSTGKYHYHHGYPAHMHYDMDGDGDRDCPYDFDDQTGTNSGSSSGSGGSGNYTPLSYSDGYADGHEDGYDEGYNVGLDIGHENGYNDYRSEHAVIEFTWLKTLGSTLLVPFFLLMAYFFILFICVPVYWLINKLSALLLRLILRNQPDELRDRISTIIAHIILVATLLYLLLPLAVDAVAVSENWIAATFITAIIIIILLGAHIYRKHNENDALSSEIKSLKMTISSQGDQLNDLGSKLSRDKFNYVRNLHRLEYEILTLKKKDALAEQSEQATLSASNNDFVDVPVKANGIMPHIPNEVYFINGDVPVIGEVSDSRPYGDLTIYVAPRGKCYHADRYCGSGLLEAMHAYSVIGKKQPCRKCASRFPDNVPDWYIELKQI